MKSVRSTLAAATAAGLLGLPLTASAAPTPSDADVRQATMRYNTSIRFLNFDHTRGYGTSFHIRGQVVVPALGGAVRGVRVTLYRKLNGSSHWARLTTRRTSQQARPKFRFTTAARANADYRVAYRGSNKLQPSRDATAVSVNRHFEAKLEDGTGRFHGRVSPRYAHRIVSLDRRTCATCGWHRVRSQHAGRHGSFSFTVNAPRKGTYYWRTSTAASTRFIRSHSAVFTTRLG